MKPVRITVDPNVCFGKPCIRGMRIPVHLIVDLVAAGKTPTEIIEDYPELELEDIKQALEYADLEASEDSVWAARAREAAEKGFIGEEETRKLMEDTLGDLKGFHKKILKAHGGKPLPDSVSDLDEIRDDT